MIGTTTGSSDGTIISLIAAVVSMSTARSYSRLAGAFHDPLDLAELAAHFLDHRPRRGPPPPSPSRRTGRESCRR
jgi:hypothetical protein